MDKKFSDNWLITSHSAAMQAVYQQLDLAIRADGTVLITGETGVGKGVLARLLHHRRQGRTGAFVTVDGTILSRDQPEAELFGIIPKFATDVAGKGGLVHSAHCGTLFFDEVGDLPFLLQGKLLGLVQERRFRRVGAQEEESADVCFVFATNRPLATMMREGTFRDDLFYRIQQVRIHLPPLRERSEDILPLVQHFLRAKMQMRTPPQLSAELEDLFLHYRWPGNIRELESCIEYLLLQQRDQKPFTAALLPPDQYEVMKRDVLQSRTQQLGTTRPPISSNPNFERVPRKAFVDALLTQHMPTQRSTVLLQTFRGGGRTVARQLAQLVDRPVLWLVDTANEQSSASLFFERLTRDSAAIGLHSFDRWLRDKVKKEPELLIIQTEPRGPEELLEDVASVVRSLLEEYAGLRFLIIGGERLLRMRRHERYSWRGLLPPNSFVDVPDLTEAEIRRILANRGLPGKAAAMLHAHTGGHPWLLFELISKHILCEEDVLTELNDQLAQSGLLDRHLDDPSAREVLRRLANQQPVAPLSDPIIRRNPRHPESRLYFDGLLTTNQRGETVFRGETLQTLTNSNELNIR